MPKSISHTPLLALPRFPTPWWTEQIQLFDGIEIHPSKVIGKSASGDVLIWPCEPETASLWAAYGLYKEQQGSRSFELFEKFKTEVEAQIFCERLFLAYPHLNGSKRPKAKHACSFIPRIAV